MSTTKVKNVEDPTPPPAAPAKVEVDVIHHNHETKFLKSKNRVTLNSHSGVDMLSNRLNKPQRGQAPKNAGWRK